MIFCSSCRGPADYIGTLGVFAYYKCRACGIILSGMEKNRDKNDETESKE